MQVIESFVKSVDDKIPVIAGITLEGTSVAAEEAKRAVSAGASAGLIYPSHGWLRFGYQKVRHKTAIKRFMKKVVCHRFYSNIQMQRRPLTT